MKIGAHSYYEYYNYKNRMFDSSSYTIGEDLGYSIICIKNKFLNLGVELSTLDMHPIEEFDKIIFFDLPDSRNIDLEKLCNAGKKLFLVILESEIIRPENFEKSNHRYFDKVFTWHDGLVDGGKYIKCQIAHKIPDSIPDVSFELKKLCTVIAGNKTNSDPRELYSKRLEAIRWFEKKHPNEFDLYGFGWDRITFTGMVSKLNKFDVLRNICAPKHRCYKGTVDSKRAVLSRYKFSICYENVKDIQGYITEKIFDCFFAGCVPVYWGAPNISNFIPTSCFIDRCQFETDDDLYCWLSSISVQEYKRYLVAIKNFLSCDLVKPFSGEFMADLVASEVGL